MTAQYVARSVVEGSDRKFRFSDRTRSVMLRLPGAAPDQLTGCWLSPVGNEPFGPGFDGLVILDGFLSELQLSPGDSISFWYGGDVGTAEVLGRTFSDPLDPTESELRRWADADALEPMQDWDLIIWDLDRLLDLYLELARTDACRSRRYFLHLLYGRVGDAVRGARVSTVDTGLVRSAASSKDSALELFARRAAALIEDPSLFEYRAWCEGGLANEPT